MTTGCKLAMMCYQGIKNADKNRSWGRGEVCSSCGWVEMCTRGEAQKPITSSYALAKGYSSPY